MVASASAAACEPAPSTLSAASCVVGLGPTRRSAAATAGGRRPGGRKPGLRKAVLASSAVVSSAPRALKTTTAGCSRDHARGATVVKNMRPGRRMRLHVTQEKKETVKGAMVMAPPHRKRTRFGLLVGVTVVVVVDKRRPPRPSPRLTHTE